MVVTSGPGIEVGREGGREGRSGREGGKEGGEKEERGRRKGGKGEGGWRETADTVMSLAQGDFF
jgi:hypothetical protein